jgi:hypothetical protein
MKKSAVLISLAVFFIFALNAVAQDEDEEERWRNFEVAMQAGLGSPSNIDWYDTLQAKLGMNFGGAGGYYINDRICFGAYFTYTQLEIDNKTANDVSDLHYKMYDVGLYAKYAFTNESNFEPYIKLSAGANFAKYPTWVGPTRTVLRELSYDPGLSSAIYLGSIYYTSDYGGIYLEIGYHQDWLQYNEGDYAGVTYVIPEDVKYIQAKAGVTVFFGPE